METILYNRNDSSENDRWKSYLSGVATIAGEWFPYDCDDHRTFFFFQRSKGKPGLAQNMRLGIVVQRSFYLRNSIRLLRM